MMKRLILALVLAAALAGISVASATAATSSTTLRFRGLAADVGFLQVDETGCISTFVDNIGISGRATESRVGSTTQVNVEAFVDIFDSCNNVETFMSCSSDSANVNIDRHLTTATVSGTLTCTDLNTGATCQLSKSETLQGTGPIASQLSHFQFRLAGYLLNQTFHGRFRDAEVTSASVTGCGVSLTEADVVYALLQSVNSGTVEVIRA